MNILKRMALLYRGDKLNRIREVTSKTKEFLIRNLEDVLVSSGLFLFVLAIFIFVGTFEGMIASSIVLFLSGIVLSYIKSKS